MQTCNKRLLSISVPNTISRSPTSLENVACWKGTLQDFQYMHRICYFSSHRVWITVMVTILLNTCTTRHHATQLFWALFTFGSQYSHFIEWINFQFWLQIADALLHQFYAEYENMYGMIFSVRLRDWYKLIYIGISAVTMNVHLLSHLMYYVRAWGPLWTMSCFAFESLNGELRKLFHGTRNMSAEVLWYSN